MSEDTFMYGFWIILISMVLFFAGLVISDCSGSSASLAKDAAENWTIYNNVKAKNISCNSNGDCSLQTTSGKFLALKCPVLKKEDCVLVVKSVNLD